MRRAGQEGYSIIIIAALFVAFMVVGAALLEGNVASEQITRQQDARNQLGILENALAKYALFNNGRYPCPAQYNLVYTNSNFGVQVTQLSSGATADCVTATISGMDYIPTGATSDDNVRGMIPVRTLAPYGITIDDAFDPWGNRIIYVVNKQLTPGGNGVPTTRASVQDSVTGQYYYGSGGSAGPDFLLLSYGQDHVGGILKSQTGTMTPTIACTSDGNPRTKDCLPAASGATPQFIAGPLLTSTGTASSSYFDDTVVGFFSGQDCIVGTQSWTNSGFTCGGTPSFTLLPNGATYSIMNTNGSRYGSVTLSCVNGVLLQSKPRCASAPGLGNCTWTSYNDVWPTTSCLLNPPGITSQPACDSNGSTTPGTIVTYTTASGEYTAVQKTTCAVAAGCTVTSNVATASMRQCRP